MEQRNEPSTAEIVRSLKACHMARCCDCTVCDPRHCEGDVLDIAADRLESREREIEELKSEAIVNALENAERIATLTARAERA